MFGVCTVHLQLYNLLNDHIKLRYLLNRINRFAIIYFQCLSLFLALASSVLSVCPVVWLLCSENALNELDLSLETCKARALTAQAHKSNLYLSVNICE